MKKENTKDLIVLNPEGTIEIIEFFDYHCGHCKRQAKVIDELLKNRKDIRIVLRPIPVLGEKSLYATQIGYAILLLDPQKFIEYYNDVMHNTNYDEDPVYSALSNAEIDIKKLKDMLDSEREQIDSIMGYNMDTANQSGIQGTPAFIINGKVTMGEIDLDTLIKKLA